MDNINNGKTNNDWKNLNFYEVLREIYKNNLSFFQFELYFTFFKKQICDMKFYSIEGVQFSLALKEATVITNSLEEDEKIELYKTELHNYVADAIIENEIRAKKSLANAFIEIVRLDSNVPISTNIFIKYCGIIRIAFLSENKGFKEFNLLKMIKKLQNIEVKRPTSLSELFQFHDCQKLLAYYANELSKEDEMKKIRK